LHQDVVDRHRHQIDSHGVVAAEGKGKSQFRSDAVGACHQHRLAVAARQFKERTKAAYTGKNPCTERTPCQGTDPLDQCVARIDVHAGVRVTQGKLQIRPRRVMILG